MKTNLLTKNPARVPSFAPPGRCAPERSRILPGRAILPAMFLGFLRSVVAWLLGGLLVGITASGATLYVWQDSPSPGLPHTNWRSGRPAPPPSLTLMLSARCPASAGSVWETER